MTDHIKIEHRDHILTLTFARPDKKNAITNAMYGKLADALIAAETDKATRVIVLRGEGDMFTAGNDVGEFAMMATDAFNDKRHVSRFVEAIARSTRPLVAAVQGRAVGIGTTMLLHCDFVVLAEDAQLSTPFVNLALVPEAASSLLMPLRRDYDLVVLDCPPSISLLSENVLHAADLLLVPLIPTTLSVRTLDQLTEFIADFDRRKPKILAFFSMLDRRKRLHREIVEELPLKREDVTDVAIPALSAIEQMSVHRAPVTATAPRSQAARMYGELWAETRSRARLPELG